MFHFYSKNALFLFVFSLFSNFLIAETSLLIAETSLQGQLNQATDKYIEGEKSTDVKQREKNFNDALGMYLNAEPKIQSGKLFYNIGNCYFQLGEYGLAILYYNKALKELPRDQRVEDNLLVAEKKAGVNGKGNDKKQSILFVLEKFSSYEKKIFVISFLLFSVCFVSLAIWFPYKSFKRLAGFSLLFVILGVSNLFWSSYFSPLEAVLIRSTPLRKDAGEQYATIQSAPCLSGTKVDVVGVSKDGSWLKVKLPSGEEGYLSKENARII